MARRTNNNQLLYLAIVALLLLFVPFLVSAVEQNAFNKASAAYSEY